jgi:hypothetical protein
MALLMRQNRSIGATCARSEEKHFLGGKQRFAATVPFTYVRSDTYRPEVGEV